ncbi:hypothetical protein JR316_0001389 [Psilocybe cubensis]|uniref:Uncharacterized protein n=1 Tax=Psilocybe cubensis TaxID=181762 RepID=A0ACB8HI82_PSICU|nr:hypothetical protein JR316_0001389 [Psilocybe cubensis]KAH9487316.1 hypothetical protein JR316_0001389 [Psilocybe cubensis]
MRKPDTEVVKLLQEEHIDRAIYGIGLTSYKAIRRRLGLLSARQQGHTVESIKESMVALRKRFPKAGARDMGSLLFHHYGMLVPRDLIVVYFRVYEPELIRERKARRLRRRRFWAAGVNDIIAVDQHDKWKRFGLALHNGGDPFDGYIHWYKIWWTNSNPKLIASYYLNVVEKNKCIPLITQSDPGSENYGIANAQTTLRHMHDPRLIGTIQHRWMRKKKNIKPEISWSQLRSRFTPGFEDLLDYGVNNGLYDIGRPLDLLVFRYLFIPFLQVELDAWTDMVNNTQKRSDRNKILPHGIPQHIHLFPERYGCLDFKIQVSQEAIDEVRQIFAPPEDPVFQLVPPEFKHYADILYQSMESPVLTSENIWEVYSELLYRFENLDNAVDFIEECQVYIEAMELQDNEDNENSFKPQGRDLFGGIDNSKSDGTYYMGGVNNGHGLDNEHYRILDAMDENDGELEIDEVQFTDDENEEDEGEDVLI